MKRIVMIINDLIDEKIKKALPESTIMYPQTHEDNIDRLILELELALNANHPDGSTPKV